MSKLNRPTEIKTKLQRPVLKPKIPKVKEPDWYWKLIVGGKGVCYVCGKSTQGRPHKFIGHHKFTEEPLERHDYCEPGSQRYIDKFGGFIGKGMENVSAVGRK